VALFEACANHGRLDGGEHDALVLMLLLSSKNMAAYQIEPHFLATIKDLRLIAKKIADGYFAGLHRSSLTGTGLEFSEYRSYRPGDDLRLVDWKMYARSDRYFVRQSETDTSATVWFILDCSASMDYAENGVTKMDYARWIAASLGYLAVHQGDAIGLEVVRGAAESSILVPRRDPLHLERFLIELERASPNGSWPTSHRSVRAGSIARREMSVVVTDLYEKENEIIDYLCGLRAANHETLLFHLMGHDELEFNYEGLCSFEDLETGRTVEVDAELVRSQYQAKLSGWLNGLRRRLSDLDISYQIFTLDQRLEFALRSFLLRRMGGPCSN
jgi:uncharacterized protein (DUF58 family)